MFSFGHVESPLQPFPSDIIAVLSHRTSIIKYNNLYIMPIQTCQLIWSVTWNDQLHE